MLMLFLFKYTEFIDNIFYHDYLLFYGFSLKVQTNGTNHMKDILQSYSSWENSR